MPEKTVGYIKMEWTCPNCNTRNPGPVKTCQSCGAPQPANVKFEMGADQSYVTDEKEVQQAEKGPDIHCGFCGARNPADATTCSQCGGDLKEGMARQAGQLVDQSAAPVPTICPNCGFKNPTSTGNCAQCGAPLGAKAPPPPPPAKGGVPWKWIGIGAAVLGFLAICCIAVALFLIPTKSVNASVDSVHWQTVANVEAKQPVHYTDQTGSVPSGAYDTSCHDETKEVCQDQTVDQGNGYAKVEKVCQNETTTYCSYTVDEWKVIQSYPEEGTNLTPVWDNPSLASGQRRGTDSATYTVVFVSSDNKDYTYHPGTVTEYQQYAAGSLWLLKLSTIGNIVSVEPAK